MGGEATLRPLPWVSLQFEESAAHSPQDVNLQLRLADALCWDAGLLATTGRFEGSTVKLYDRTVELYGKLPPTTAPSNHTGSLTDTALGAISC